MSFATRERVLWVTLLVLLALAVVLPSLQQPVAYHDFADARRLLGIPRAFDTLSNLPFLLAGLLGLWRLRQCHTLPAVPRRMAMLFFVGLLATALGSGWYHLAPDDARLVWDRAGMTPGFAGIVGLAVAQRVSDRSATPVAVAILLLGWLSIAVWSHSGNLTPWATLQIGGVLLLLGLMTQPPVDPGWPVAWWFVVASYALAKLAETFDPQVFAFTGVLSGHSLKHLLASLAAVPVIQALSRSGTAP